MEEEVQARMAIMEEDESKNADKKFCPKIEPANNNMGELSYNEKLNIIENDVQSLYEFCLEKKFTKKEIHNCVSGMYGPKKSVTKKTLEDSTKSVLLVSVIVALIAVSWVQEDAWSFVCANLKLIVMKSLPYWDWQYLHQEDCLMRNPWLREESVKITKEYCKYCNNIKINRYNNASHSILASMLDDDGFDPLVVSDAVKHMDVKKLSMDEIIQLYQNHPILSKSSPKCGFETNAKLFNYAVQDFVKAYANKPLPPPWHASWVNCDAKAAKIIRRYHLRPYFLPLAMQLESGNTIITSLGMDPNASFPLLNSHNQGMLISVISGSLHIMLTPNEKCMAKFGCTKMKFDVFSGETLFFINDSWQCFYSSRDSGMTIAIGNSVTWDEK